MQVLIDCGRASQDRAGFGEVARQYAAALMRRGDADVQPLFVTSPKFKSFAQTAQEIDVPHIAGKFSLRSKILRLFDKEICPHVYHGNGHSVRHALYSLHLDIPAHDKKPFVLTIHDVHYIVDKRKLKHRRRKARRFKNSIARADALCFISNYAWKNTAEHFNISGKETHIIYNGTEKPANPRRPQWFRDEMRPFLLGISAIVEHKRFHLLPPMMRHLPGMSLIIAGRQLAGMPMLADAIRAAGVSERIVTPGLISDEEKAYLLQECAGFAHPSKHEGFGMPVVEALHFGKPVFCFPISALTEVGGDHAFYWDGESPAEMAELVRQYAEVGQSDTVTASIPPEIAQARAAWAAEFTWDKNASAYVELYKQLAGR